MAKDSFNKLIKGWDGQVQWLDSEIKYLSGILSSICKDNNGTIFHDEELPDHLASEYRNGRVESILNSFVAGIVKKQYKQSIPVRRTKSETFSVDFPFIEPTEHIPRINLNLATNDELEKLPGIGKKTAARIISYRNGNGGVKRITELKKIKGISDKEIRKFAHKVYLKTFKSIATTSEGTTALINNPTFKNFIAYLNTTDILVSKYSRNPKDLKDLIIREIEGISNSLKMRPKLHGYSPGIRASELNNRFKEKTELKDYIEKNKAMDTHGVLLRDSIYYYFTLKLLKSAKNKIRLTMFYLMFLDEEKHPSDKLMEELIKAKKRGVDIKVILDHQEENDPKPSRIINKEASEYLHENNIPVTFDTEEVATHTKLLLVDESHVVIGSHNWTAGSYFVYRDTSVYINSSKLADHYYSHFESLWKKYRK